MTTTSIIFLLIAIAVAPIAAVWVLPALSDWMSGIALAFGRKPAASRSSPRAKLLFLIPAHNEELMIGDCVRSHVSMDKRASDWDIVVVADNCTDGTAEIARANGARVMERFNRERRGKPAAIQWVLDQTNLDAYDAVVIVDADSVVVPGFADALAQHGPLKGKVVQGYYGLLNEAESWLSELGGLLVRVRYEGQYLLKRSTGLNCPLTGNGMCIGTDVLERAGWASDSLTENWEMYARYTALGETIEYEPAARLSAHESGSLKESATRRRRWQAGRWLVFRQYSAPILRSRRIGLRQKLDAIAEIAALGPVIQAAVALFGMTVFAALPGTAPLIIAAMFGLALFHLGLWTAVVWAKQPNRGRLAVAFLRLPSYAIWRMSIVVRSISTGRSGEWERSPRKASEIS